MPAPDLYTHLLHRLNETGIPYMITGGVAAIMYGEPRLTNDADIVVALGVDDAERFAEAFPSPEYYVPPIEVIREEAARPAWGHFNVLHTETALRADVYPLGQDALGTWGMAHRRLVTVADSGVWVAPIEYVILKKLIYYRDGGSERHLRDIAAMRRLSGEIIDDRILRDWLVRLKLEPGWARAEKFAE
jgi:hypothetical protein